MENFYVKSVNLPLLRWPLLCISYFLNGQLDDLISNWRTCYSVTGANDNEWELSFGHKTCHSVLSVLQITGTRNVKLGTWACRTFSHLSYLFLSSSGKMEHPSWQKIQGNTLKKVFILKPSSDGCQRKIQKEILIKVPQDKGWKYMLNIEGGK